MARHHQRAGVPSDQQGRARVGRRHVAEGAVGRRPRGGGSEPASTSWRRMSSDEPVPVSATLRAANSNADIQFLLGHFSIDTSERYLGCKQELRVAVNDQLGSPNPTSLDQHCRQGRWFNLRPGRLSVRKPADRASCVQRCCRLDAVGRKRSQRTASEHPACDRHTAFIQKALRCSFSAHVRV